jgi:hypothetical protein
MVIIGAISTIINDHRLWLNTEFTRIALDNRQHIFTYIDSNQDAYLFNYFKLGNDLPRVVVYDFENKRHYTHSSNNVSEVLIGLYNNSLTWTTGNWFEDFLAKFGIQLNQKIIMYILVGAFILIIGFLVFVVFFTKESEEVKVKQSEVKEMQEKKNN